MAADSAYLGASWGGCCLCMFRGVMGRLLTLHVLCALGPSWSGCPLQDIHFGASCAPVLPPLTPSVLHAVLFQPPLRNGDILVPFPAQFRDVWDSRHVRMPCSKQSVYPVGKAAGSEKILCPRWDLMRQSLEKPILNTFDLEEAILTYNSVYSKKWQFHGLHDYFSRISKEKSSHFFAKTLPKMINLALELPKVVTHSLPLLRKQEGYSISMSQKQVACLLANAFLCTFPRRNTSNSTSEYSSYPSINFNSLFSSDAPGEWDVSGHMLQVCFGLIIYILYSMPLNVARVEVCTAPYDCP